MAIALQAVSILIVGWLPGAVIFRAPVLDRDRRAALDADERAFWQLVVSLAISLAVVLALAAIGRYTFGRLLLADLLLAGLVAAVARGRLALHGATRPTIAALVPLALIALGVWRFFPPAEYVIGGKDPGVYVSEGIQIAQRGSLVTRDETVASVPSAARDLFLPRYLDFDGTPRRDYYSVRFMGFYILDPDSGDVVGQFPHLFPASIAIGYGVHGLTGALWVTGVWAILGMLAVYFAGARLLGRPAAAIAVALLAINVAETWFGRYPNAEVVMQAVLFAALLAYARSHVDQIAFFAPVAGALLGPLLFVRLDTVLAIGAVGGAAIAGLARHDRFRASFWIALAIPALLAWPYLVGLMRPYSDLYRVYLTHLPGGSILALAIAGSAAWWLVVQARRSDRVSRWIGEFGPMLLASAVAVAGLYALFLRQPGGKLTAYDAYALRTFANFYFTVPGVLAALLGFWLMARNRFWRDPALFLTVAVFAGSVFYKIRIVPEHFWMARRFIPVVLPGALLFLSAAAFSTSTAGWRGRAVRWIAGGAFVALLASTYLRVSGPVVAHTEYEGLIPRIESLAARIGDDDLLIVESRDAGGDVHVLATPLAYIYAKHVLLLASAAPDRSSMAAFIAWARTRYDHVYFVGGGGTDLLSRGYGVRPVGSERFEVPEFELATDGLPRPSVRKFIFGLYEFVDAPSDTDGWFDLDVGNGDDLYVLRFQISEVTDGRTFRWTGPTSYVVVPDLPSGARELTLVLNDGGRPPAAEPARVSVFLENVPLGAIAVEPGPFRAYSLPLPPEVVAAAARREPVRVRLVSTLWKPHEVLGSPDMRTLGVMVDRVTIK